MRALLLALLLGAAAVPADGILVLVTAAGEPLAGAVVTISGESGEIELGATGAAGAIRSGAIAAGSWTVRAAKDGLAAVTSVEVASGQEAMVTLRLDPPATVEVLVSGEDGGLAGALVTLDGASSLAATTDSEGRALLGPVEPGTWSLAVEHPDHTRHARRLELSPGAQTVRVRLKDLGLSAELENRLSDLHETGLQVMVVLDATRSMDHLIEGSRRAILDLAAALDTLVPGTEMGIGAYRAPPSDWEIHPFSRDLAPLGDRTATDDLASFLFEIDADQGGRESVMVAVEWALAPGRGWLEGTEKVVILLGDAMQRGMTEETMARRFREGSEPLGGATLYAMGASPRATGERMEDASEAQFRRLTRLLDGDYRPLPEDAGEVAGTLDLLRTIVAFAIGTEHESEIQALLTPEGLAEMRAAHGW